MGELDALEKSVLKERRFISNELAARGAGSGLLVSEDGRLALMVNEEDHIRLHSIVAAGDLGEPWKLVDALDSELDAALDYAFSPRWGYLTACPTNVGTGLRASVMLHLPALDMLDEAESVVRGLTRMGLAVRGVFGEGTQASGNMYQISNQSTLGRKESDIISGLVEIVQEVARHEANARVRILEGRRTLALDRIARSMGILTQARQMSSGEMAELLSTARLGIEFGMLKGIGVAAVNDLLLAMQPGHLQKMAGHKLGSAERDALRADMGRRRFAGVELAVD
jgi:protein arginine kinase